MESATFRKWLMDRGCSFEQHQRATGKGISAVTVRRGHRKADLPLVGSHKRLPADVVHAVVDSLGLDRSELPGPKSRA